MRQHPIPQNVLDIEFKLFTKFTLKEFAYLAVGVTVGGIFLYMTVGGDLPGIIGIPVFVVLSGAGAFLALVPINDQDADKFITNYFSAINKPTQRVWLNKAMKEDRTKPQINETQVNSKKKGGKGVVIGGSKIPVAPKSQIFVENPGDDILEEADSTTEVKKEVSENIQKQEFQTAQDSTITISEENISKYQFEIKSVDQLPGNINMWLCTRENQPLTGIHTYLKNADGKILYANKTGPNGYFLTDKYYEPGIYTVEFENVPSGNFKLRLVLTSNISKLPLKIQVG